MRKNKLMISLFLLLPLLSKAQCAMCRAALLTSEDTSRAEGINNGIMYLMAIPYIMVAGIGFALWWTYMRKKKPDSTTAEE